MLYLTQCQTVIPHNKHIICLSNVQAIIKLKNCSNLKHGRYWCYLPFLLFVFLIFCRSDSGFQLLICSWDGTVAYADFTAEEVGRPMSEEEKVWLSSLFFIRIYEYNPLNWKRQYSVHCILRTKGSTHCYQLTNLHFLILFCAGKVSQASLWC